MALDSWNFSSPDFAGGGSIFKGGGLSSSTFSNAGGAVSDLFAAKGLKTKAKGNLLEAEQYDIAAEGARRNAQFTKTSTEIKSYQTERQIGLTLGQQQADVAASGFGAEGSALDLLRDSAAQGALVKAALNAQGAIDEAGFEDQAKSYKIMAESARLAAAANEEAASGAKWGAALKGAAAGASAGSAFGPWGTAIGAGVGAAASLFGSD